MLLPCAAAAASGDSYLKELIETARRRGLPEDSTWQLLLHDRAGLFGGVQSDARGKRFFLSPRGRKDPEAELEATLAAFFDAKPSAPEVQHPQCRFPARYEWLKERLSFDASRLPEQACPRFEEWRNDFRAASVSLVFATSYLNNPASLYGHTFLRVDRAGARAGDPLTEECINFAADTGETNGIIFALKGLLGAYPGRFASMPYYFKVQQYNNMESRDLWEYSLRLTPAQTDRMLAHLWELGQAYFPYYFLTSNCAYYPMTLLEVADPSLKLTRRPWLRVIPMDTVRVILDQPGLVSSRKLRPSALRLMFARRALLSRDEMLTAEAVAKGSEESVFKRLDSLDPPRRALALDSAYDYFRWRHGGRRYQSPEEDRWERLILVHRSQLDVKSSDVAALKLGEAFPPDEGHATGRVSYGEGRLQGRLFDEVSLRPALHDLAEAPEGYVPDSQLEMFHLTGRFDRQDGRGYLERFTIMDAVSLSPLDRWVKRTSWNFSFGLERPRDLPGPPDRRPVFRLSGGAGPAVQTHLIHRETWYVMGNGVGDVGGVFKDSYRVGAGGTAGVTAELFSFWRTTAEAGELRYVGGPTKKSPGWSWINSFSLGKDFELRARWRRDGVNKEALFSLSLYL